LNGRDSAIRSFHQNDLKHWYRLLRRTSGLLNTHFDRFQRIGERLSRTRHSFSIDPRRSTMLLK